MRASFDRIVVIFNPQSTGDGPQLAEQLHADLTRRLPEVPLRLCPTEHAGHARDLAREAAQTGQPLIVSVSGDGGYNEVVDGVMQAGNDNAVCAVKAAGNANDHRRTTAQRPLVDAITAGEVRRIDLLRLTVGDGAQAGPDTYRTPRRRTVRRDHPAAQRKSADPARRPRSPTEPDMGVRRQNVIVARVNSRTSPRPAGHLPLT